MNENGLPFRAVNDNERPPAPRREAAFNAPAPVLLLIAALIICYAVPVYWMPGLGEPLLLYGSLIPARLFPGADQAAMVFPGGWAASVWTLFSYTFLHGSWPHVLLNAVWLLAFGTPMARRLGTVRFFAFYFLCGAIGGLIHAAFNAGSLVPAIGASGAISGLMGGAARFVFLADGPLGAVGRSEWSSSHAVRAEAGIVAALTDRRILIFVAVWVGLNLLQATGLPLTGQPVQVAWIAHLGGFFTGLLLFGLFDPPAYSPSGGPGNVNYGEWKGKL
ncbi:MAG: rhomboid family intramembrane serine protease [Parvibaculaceae bacterium]|nr:rhomboid family intramembrane serine protease [Parvibaculaceae bacterium]